MEYTKRSKISESVQAVTTFFEAAVISDTLLSLLWFMNAVSAELTVFLPPSTHESKHRKEIDFTISIHPTISDFRNFMYIIVYLRLKMWPQFQERQLHKF